VTKHSETSFKKGRKKAQRTLFMLPDGRSVFGPPHARSYSILPDGRIVFCLARPEANDEYFETGIKKGRGLAKRSLDLIEAMRVAAEAARPITGRGVGYKLFAAKLIPSMADNEMQRVYRLLKVAREQGDIPWEWDDVCEDDDGRELIALYVGDFDPSGMFMSEEDLPKRFSKYDGHHITLKRIALTGVHVLDLPSFLAANKKKDPRYKWFVARYGRRCWELDAMDPNDLRNCVEQAIKKLIEPKAWKRCEKVNKAERRSLETVIAKWGSHDRVF
jgi:hypothetical protein